MSRFARNRIILAKKETTYGTFASPAGSDAVLCADVESNPIDATTVNREFVRGYIGSREQLIAKIYRKLGFKVEAVGNATGSAPNWGGLVEACAALQTTAAARVDYTPITTNGAGTQDALSLEWYEDGVRRRAAGARGDFVLDLVDGEVPKWTFSYTGLDNQAANADTASANPSATYSNWKTPEVIKNGVTSFYIGATVNTTGAPVITGGTVIPCNSFSLKAGNAIAMPETFGDDSVDINDRNSTVDVELSMTAVQEVNNLALLRGNAALQLVITHGTVAGRKLMVVVPSAKIISMQPVSSGQYMRQRLSLSCEPVAGNDEWRVITSFA